MNIFKRVLTKLHSVTGEILYDNRVINYGDLNPIQSFYLCQDNEFYIDADVNHCISNYWMPLSNNLEHPYVETCRQIIDKPDIPYTDTELYKYALNIKKEFLIKDLKELRGNRIIGDLPLYAFTFPWEVLTPQLNVERVKQWVDIEELERKSGLSHLDGMIGFTEVSENKIEKEVNLLRSLVLSIQSKGYLQPKDSPITACLLIKDKQFKYLIHGGNHRAAVLTALGFNTIPLIIKNSRLPARVHYSDLTYWPNVTNGNFSYEEAENIFKKVFD